MDLKKKTLDEVINITFDRIKRGIYFDTKLKPYRKDFLEKCLEYYQNEEKYQECIIIRDIIKIRFNHEDESSFRNI